DLAARGVRVVALAATPALAHVARADVPDVAWMLALTTPDAAQAYAIFAGGGAAGVPEHAEFLIDHRGTLRARWIGVPEGDEARTAAVLDALRAPAAASAPTADAHEH
ncbi:MAG TPA: hypothetical protein VJQ49_00790, partial [Casimicrobiaceae bacterium]|nr:hypothetical protein [Casimicrobiaceae bacterium]